MRENSVYCEEAKRWLQVPGIYRHFKHTENGIPNNYMYCTMFVSKPKDIHEFPKNIASYKWMKVFSTEENTQITLILIEGTWYHTKESCKKDMVIYKSLYDEHIPYARPLEMFLDNGAEGREDNKTGQKYRMEAIGVIIK